jgi:N4-gp56 family major capsid protein
MVNPNYTDTGAFSNLIQIAYDQRLSVEFAAATILRSFADKKVVNQTQPGQEVVFHIHKKMAVNTSPLGETEDGNGVALTNPKPVTLTVNEYGNYTVYTEALQQFALDDSLASNVVNTIKTNLLETLDALVANVLDGTGLGNSVKYNTIVNHTLYTTIGTRNAAVTAGVTTVLTADDLRTAVAELRSDAVPTWDSGYVAIMHPRVASKFRASTDAAGWRDANTYVNVSGLINGEIGTFEGVRVIENPRVPVSEDGIYTTFILGKEALAEAVVKEPSTVIDGNIEDVFGRKTAAGWYGILGWTLFRSESLYAVKSVLVND